MTYTNLKINKKCNKCGSCMGYAPRCFLANGDGSIVVGKGVYIEKGSQEYSELNEVCPMGAFEIDKSVDKETIIVELIRKLEEYKGINTPTNEAIKFNKEEYNIQIPTAFGEYEYVYSSDRKADKAALNEFERAMFSQVDNIFLRIISEYKTNKLKPYYSENIDYGSIYAENNKYISELLRGINQAMDSCFPDDFSEINIIPNKHYKWEELNDEKCVAENFLPIAKKYFDYNASSYSCDWTTDGYDDYVGEGLFGNSKFNYKCGYMDLEKAFNHLANDIKFCLGLVDWEIEECAINDISYLIEEYNQRVSELLKEKKDIIKKFLKNIKKT